MPDVKPIPESEWKWGGFAGHLCISADCRFHLKTTVGDVIVSTVGYYAPEDRVVRSIMENIWGEPPYPIGYNDDLGDVTYETMVHRNWEDLDWGTYNTPESATDGHMALCRKWAAIGPSKPHSERQQPD